jgi:DNA polymerase alpha subunit A
LLSLLLPCSIFLFLVAYFLCFQGQRVGAGDIVPYIISEGDGSMSTRAIHPTQLALKDPNNPDKPKYKIDLKWYLSSQVLPPVARLCAPIEETSPQMLAECLGLLSFFSSHRVLFSDYVLCHLFLLSPFFLVFRVGG